MSNIHLKVTVEKNWRAQNLDFLRFKNFPQLQLTQMSLKFKNSCWKIQRSGSKSVCGFCIIFILKGIDVLKSKSSCFLLNININSNKNKTELKKGTY